MLALLKQDGRLPEAAVKVFGVDLMTGLQYMHCKGVLYCDLKPSNVLVDEYGVLKLSDFGLSRRIPGKDGSTGSPKNNADSKGGDSSNGGPRKRGTPCYMAPSCSWRRACTPTRASSGVSAACSSSSASGTRRSRARR